MVKNIPTIERSTKIRFGKNAMDDQGENTIVFNASDEQIDATQPGSVYITPLRQVLDISDRDNKILTYNRDTKEMSDSGVAAVDVLQPNLQATTNLGNTTTNTVEFRNTVTSLVTTANVGIANSLASHTLSVGSNLYVDDTGSNVLVVNGNTNIKGDIVIQGNAQIDGVITVIDTENLTIGDAIIELGRNNTVGDTTLDLGLIMNRPGSNVTVGFLEGVDELALAYTETSADSKTITPLTSETLDVHVYGRVFTESNVGIMNTSPIHTLDVGSNLFVDEYGSNVLVVTGNTSITGDLTVDTDVLRVDSTNNKIGINTVLPDAELHVVGNVYSSSNLTVDTDTFHVDVEADHIGINTKYPDAELHVVGNVYASSNLTVDLDTFHVDVEADHVGINTKYPDAELHVVGNVYASSNLTVDLDTFHVDVEADHVGINTKYPDAELHVVGNVYASSNLTVDTDTFHVDTENDSVGVGTINPSANLHVVGNVYASSNLTVDLDTFHVDVDADHVGINTKYPDAELHVVGNVYASSNLTVDLDTFHVDVEADHVGINTKYPDAELHVVGNVYASSNLTVDVDTLHVDVEADHIGINTKYPDAELHVVGNVYSSSNLTVDLDTFHVDVEADHIGINTKYPDAELHVVGNVYASSNLTVDDDTFHVDVEADHIGINTKYPDAELHVVGNVYASSNLTVDTDTFHVDVEADHVGINTKYPDAELHVVGNVYASSNLTVDTDTFHVDVEADHVGINTKYPDAELHVVGNVYASSNLTVDVDTLHVDVEADHVGINTKYPDAELHVVGNVYASSNLTVDVDTLHVDVEADHVGINTKYPDAELHVVGNAYVTNTLKLDDPTTALITDLTANVEVKLNQLANVVINTTDVNDSLRAEHTLVYDGANWYNDYPKHTYVKIFNDSGGSLAQGSAVYIKGMHNANLLEVGLARADSPDTMPAFGIVAETITEQGGEGIAVTYGKALTTSVDAFIEGETVYVSNVVAGGLSNVKPFYTDSVPNLIQNVGVVTKSGSGQGDIFVTGIGRANDVPNAQIVLDETAINWVYVNDANNDFKKIEPSNLLTQLQTLQQVTDTGNTTSNTIQFTNVTTGLVTTGNVEVGSNIAVIGLTDPINKHIPMVGTDGFLEKSPIYFTAGGTYVVSAAEAEFLGNLTLSGNTTILNSESVTISDRIFGVAANNSVSGLDSGFMIEHQEGDPLEYANVALIYHADEHRFSISYTQNTFTDDHILHYEDETHRMLINLIGNVNIDHNLTVDETLDVTGTVTFADDLTVGAASNLFVDVSTSRVGINEASPGASLDVGGDVRVQSTTDTATRTAGALVVSGGLGVASNIHSTNVYVGSHVGVGTVSTTQPLHVVATSVGGVYVGGDGVDNHARVTLATTGDTANDPVVSFSVDGGEAFSVGIDNSINDTFNLANHPTNVGENVRVAVTPVGHVGVGTITPAANLHVVGNVYVSSNLTVDTNTLHVDSVANRVGILTKNPGYALDVHGAANVGTLVTTSLYGPIVGSNTAAVTDLTATTIYGTISGSNTASVSDLTATTIYGTISGSNTASVSDLTATTIYGTISGSNTASVSDLTATTIYGTISGSNTASVSDLTATTIYGTLAGANTASVSTLTANDTTQATSRTTGAVTIAGGLGVSTNVHAANVYVTGGLITNTGGVTKKTYSQTGTITSGTAPNIDIVFSDHAFSAKITAQLIESDIKISTLFIDVTGGRRGGASTSTLNIAKGPLSIFGDATSNPWSTTVGATTTTVTLTPSTNLDVTGYYNIFVEYVSGDAAGSVSTIGGTSTGY